METSIVDRTGFAPKCERILSLQHGDNLWLAIRTYYLFRPAEANPEDVLEAYIRSPIFRDDMVGPGFQLNTSRDVHGPFLASYVTSEHYEAIGYKRFRELLEERINTPFHEHQEANPSMPENERDKLEEALAKTQDAQIYRLTLEHTLDGTTDPKLTRPQEEELMHPKHDMSDILWEYQEYLVVPSRQSESSERYLRTFTVGFD
jgi:hypothetical protein